MIYDTINNFKLYTGLHSGFNSAYEFLTKSDLITLLPGKYDLGNNCFANVDEYKTKPLEDCFIESHFNNIDIQLLLKGKEKFGFTHISKCHVLETFPDKDYQKLSGKPDFITLNKNEFIILFPHDAHVPQISISDHQDIVKKIVFKIPVNYT